MAARELAEDLKARWEEELANRFPAPHLTGADVTAGERSLVVERAGGRHWGRSVLFGGVGLMFILIWGFAGFAGELPWWGASLGVFLGGVALLAGIAPEPHERVVVTPEHVEGLWEGLGKDRSWTLPASEVKEVRFVRTVERDDDGDTWNEWRCGVVTTSGEVRGVGRSRERGDVRAVAERTREMLSLDRPDPVPLEVVEPPEGAEDPLRSLADLAGLDLPEFTPPRPRDGEGGGASDPDLDATLQERVSGEAGVASPGAYAGVDVAPRGSGTTVTVTHPGWLARVASATRHLPGGLVLAILGGSIAVPVLLTALTTGFEAGMMGWAFLAFFLGIPSVLLLVGLWLTMRGLARTLGREFVRVTPDLLEHGWRIMGRDVAVTRWALQSLEDLRVPAGRFDAVKVVDAGEPQALGFHGLPQHLAQDVVDAIRWAVARVPPEDPSAPPAGWPRHPRVQVEDVGSEVTLTVSEVRWPWLLGVLGFASIFGLVGLVGGLGLLAAVVLSQGDPVWVRVIALAFVGVPLFFLGVGVWMGRVALASFGGAPRRHRVTRDHVAAEIPGADPVEVALEDVEHVKIDEGNVVLATREGDVDLGFSVLEDAADLAWARRGVEHAVWRFQDASTSGFGWDED